MINDMINEYAILQINEKSSVPYIFNNMGMNVIDLEFKIGDERTKGILVSGDKFNDVKKFISEYYNSNPKSILDIYYYENNELSNYNKENTKYSLVNGYKNGKINIIINNSHHHINELSTYVKIDNKTQIKEGDILEIFNEGNWMEMKVENVDIEYENIYKLFIKYNMIRKKVD